MVLPPNGRPVPQRVTPIRPSCGCRVTSGAGFNDSYRPRTETNDRPVFDRDEGKCVPGLVKVLRVEWTQGVRHAP